MEIWSAIVVVRSEKDKPQHNMAIFTIEKEKKRVEIDKKRKSAFKI